MKKVTKLENKNLYSIGRRIAYLRTNAGLTQEQLGKKINVNREKINRFEQDVSRKKHDS